MTIANRGTIRGDVMLGGGSDEFRGKPGILDGILDGGAGNDVLITGLGDDNLYGGDGADTLRGGAEEDALYGGKGNDLLAGDAGDDVLSGGGGKDTFQFRRGGGDDRVTDFTNGQDRLDLSAFHLSGFAALNALAADRSGGLIIDLTSLNGGTIFLDGFTKAQLDATDLLL